MKHRFFGQTLAVLMAALIAVLPQAVNAATTPIPIPGATCPVSQKDVGVASYNNCTTDNTSLNWAAKTFEVKMAGWDQELAIGMSFNGDYSRAQLWVGGNGFMQAVDVDVATFAPTDVASLGKAIEQARLNPSFSGLFDEISCRLGPNPHAQLEAYKEQIAEACPSIVLGERSNILQVAAAALQCREQLIVTGSHVSFMTNGDPSSQLLGWFVIGILIGMVVVFVIFCGGCTYGCGCVCC